MPRKLLVFSSATRSKGSATTADLEEPIDEPLPEPVVTEPVQDIQKPKKPTKTAPLDEVWPEVLSALKQQHNTLYSVARMAQPRFSDDGLELVVAFGFHQKRLNESENRQRLGAIIKDLTGQAVSINAIVDKAVEKPEQIKPKPVQPLSDSNELTTISNIFGGGELLES